MIKAVLFLCLTVCAVSACFSAPKQDSPNPDAEGGRFNAAAYMKYIVTPSSTQNIILENENLRLVFAPGMVYQLTDKSNGEMSAGRVLFYSEIAKTHTNLQESAKVFLFETDILSETAEQFFQKKSVELDADVILTPLECTEKSVIYIYEKPARFLRAGRRIHFALARE